MESLRVTKQQSQNSTLGTVIMNTANHVGCHHQQTCPQPQSDFPSLLLENNLLQ